MLKWRTAPDDESSPPWCVSPRTGIQHFEKQCLNGALPLMMKAATAHGLRDMQGLAARFFGGRSAAEPGVARTAAA